MLKKLKETPIIFEPLNETDLKLILDIPDNSGWHKIISCLVSRPHNVTDHHQSKRSVETAH